MIEIHVDKKTEETTVKGSVGKSLKEVLESLAHKPLNEEEVRSEVRRGKKPHVGMQAVLSMLSQLGPMMLVGTEVTPVTVECYEFKMRGTSAEDPDKGLTMAVIPKATVLSALDMTQEEVDHVLSMNERVFKED